MNTEAFYESRTFWAAVLTAVSPFIPGVGPVLMAEPAIFASAIASIFMGLRFTSSGKQVTIRKRK